MGFMLALALLCGFGGGNFASSMANISFFFPKAQKGTALGLNAGLGNLGVSAMQFVVPLVITTGIFGGRGGRAPAWRRPGAQVWLQNGLHLGPVRRRVHPRGVVRDARPGEREGLVPRAGGGLRAEAQLAHVLAVRRHLRLVHRVLREPAAAHQDPVRWDRSDPVRVPRPAGGRACPAGGGWLSDKLWRRASRSGTSWRAAAGGVLAFLPEDGQGGSSPAFLPLFLVLFTTSGIGNGSTFRMIPVISRPSTSGGPGGGPTRRRRTPRRRPRRCWGSLGDHRLRRLLHPRVRDLIRSTGSPGLRRWSGSSSCT